MNKRKERLPTVGQIVRARREALGLTLAALAEQIGATKGYLSMIENHKVPNPPSAQVLAALEEALGITNGELKRAADWQSTPPAVRDELEKIADHAQRGRELAEWLKSVTARRGDGAKNLDKLYRTGQLSRRVNAVLAKAKKGRAKMTKTRTSRARGLDVLIPVRYQVPLINKVSAGYPRDFTDLDYPRNVADEYVSAPDVTDPDAFAARVIGDSMEPEYHEGDIVVFSPAAKVGDGCDCFIRLEPDQETTFKRVFFDSSKTVRLQPLNPKFVPRTVERKHVTGMYKAVWRFLRID